MTRFDNQYAEANFSKSGVKAPEESTCLFGDIRIFF